MSSTLGTFMKGLLEEHNQLELPEIVPDNAKGCIVITSLTVSSDCRHDIGVSSPSSSSSLSYNPKLSPLGQQTFHHRSMVLSLASFISLSSPVMMPRTTTTTTTPTGVVLAGEGYDFRSKQQQLQVQQLLSLPPPHYYYYKITSTRRTKNSNKNIDRNDGADEDEMNWSSHENATNKDDYGSPPPSFVRGQRYLTSRST